MALKRLRLPAPEEEAAAGESGGGEALSPRKRLRRTVQVLLFVMRLEPRRDGSLVPPLSVIRRVVREELESLLLRYLTPFLGRQEMRCFQQEQIEMIVRRVMQEQMATSPFNRTIPAPRPQSNLTETTTARLVTSDTGTVQLRFLNSPKNPLYATRPIEAETTTQRESRTPVKIAIFQGDGIITSGFLSSVQVEILALHGDFCAGGQESFTEEEFNAQIVRTRDGQGSVLAGHVVLTLKNGQASLDHVFFKESSYGTKIRLAVRVWKTENLTVGVRQGFTGPFTVKVHRSESNEKSHPPALEEPVYRLEEISRHGIYCDKLKRANICTVQDLLKFYFRDEPGLQKILGMKTKCWNSMIEHAKMCERGDKIYSYRIAEENAVLFFNCVYEFVGAKFGESYIACSNLDRSQQITVDRWKKMAHDKFDGGAQFDHVMINDRPEPLRTSDGGGPSFPGTGTSERPSNHHAEEGGQQQSSSANDELCHDIQGSMLNELEIAAMEPRISPWAMDGEMNDLENLASQMMQHGTPCSHGMLDNHLVPSSMNNDAGTSFPGTRVSQPHFCGHHTAFHGQGQTTAAVCQQQASLLEHVLGSQGENTSSDLAANAVPTTHDIHRGLRMVELPLHGSQLTNYEGPEIQMDLCNQAFPTYDSPLQFLTVATVSSIDQTSLLEFSSNNITQLPIAELEESQM